MMIAALFCVLAHLAATSPTMEPYPVKDESESPSPPTLPISTTTPFTTTSKMNQSMPPSESTVTGTTYATSYSSTGEFYTTNYPPVVTNGTDAPRTEGGKEEQDGGSQDEDEQSNETEEEKEEEMEEEEGTEPSAAGVKQLCDVLLRLLTVLIVVSLGLSLDFILKPPGMSWS